MTRDQVVRAAGAVACAALLFGCALTGKSDALAVRFYTPEPLPAPSARAGAASPFELRIGRVSAVADLKENIAYRDGSHEVGYYDERLWTEKPDAYLSRALARTLFEERGYRHVIAGACPTLDVRLVAFEEVHSAPHRVRAQVSFTLRDDRVVRLEETLTVERPLGTGAFGAEQVASALGDALAAVVGQIADRVEAALQASVPPKESARPPRDD